jgi:hypothetical protein
MSFAVHSIGPWRAEASEFQFHEGPQGLYAPKRGADFLELFYYDAPSACSARKCLIRLCTLMAH